ncbi:MAG: M14 family metallopeptidase, partial [Pseudomonadales bacterium]|nr:M14 family metallopeptidase [Pseudomonadales bacterium]
GQTAFEIALSGGQYSDRYGPFYGGHQPAHGHRVINEVIENYQLASRHLAVIDIHSGLGPYAHGELINDHPIASSGFQTANRWYGASVTSPAAGNSSSVRKAGLLDYRWHQLMTERGSFITLEFGSYRIQDMFEVVLENHRSWKSGNPQAIHQSAHAMLEHFCPQDNYWRELVLIKGRQVIQQALSGLQNG